MDLLCKQIGLSIDSETRKANYGLISRILLRLRGYSDNGPIRIDAPGRLPEELDPESNKDYEVFLAALNTLAYHKIIAFKPKYINRKRPAKDIYRDFDIFITNRYELERLYAELKWLGEPEDKRSDEPNVKNFVYYNPLTGRGSINGKLIYLKKSKRNNKVKAKEIFDLLFAAAPNSVPRKKIADKLGLVKNDPEESDRITQALSNLCRRFGVTKNVIYIRQGSCVLNAATVPIDELPDFFTFPE